MERYEKYKDSGVVWIGEIPEHWTPIKMKFFFSEIIGGAWGNEELGDENDLICLRIADFDFNKGIFKEGEDFTKRNIGLNEASKRILNIGDLVLEKSGGGEKMPVGRVVLFNKTFRSVSSNFTNRLVPKKEFNSQFLVYIFKFLYDYGLTFKHLNQSTGIQNLNTSSFLSEFVVVPDSISEQTAIANYLDKKTSELDTLITKKEKLIELLKEERTAIINQAVTKGLEPDVDMQDSGVEWLGEIPAHWIVSPLKFYCNRITDGAHISPDRSEEIFPFVSTVDIADGLIDFENCIWTSTDCFDYLVKNRCQPFNGDVLFSKDGTIGRTCIIDFDRDFVVASSLVIISPNPKYLSFRFLDYVLNSSVCIEYANMLLSGSALRRISITKIANMPISFPSIEEQFAIVKHLQIELEKLENIVEKTNQEITLLKEYKTALISEVVTGKVKVV